MFRMTCLIFLFTTIFLIKLNTVTSSNTTRMDLDDDDDNDDDDDEADDEELEKMNFEEFKRTIKRHRRLIPYTSYYTPNNNDNNNINNKEQLPLSYIEEQTLVPQSLIGNIDRQLNQKRQNDKLKNLYPYETSRPTVKQEKFIPSVQYDPKNIGGDNDYFTPVRYNNKINYDKYYRDYEEGPSIYHEISNPIIQENRYYVKEQLPQTIAYNSQYIRDHQKQVTHVHPQYLVEYIPRVKPTQQQDNPDYYPVDNFESLRYVKIKPPSTIYHQSSRVLPSINKQRPVYQQHNPIINDENIVKSLKLTNQLPEILNKDNIDSSIKTLVEILNLLHNVKKPNIPQQQIDQTSTEIEKVPIVIHNNPNYDRFNRKYTRPKVVTETRFQATTTSIPPVVAEKSIQYKVSPAYTNNMKSKLFQYSDYTDDAELKNHHVQYYTPSIQDIDEVGNVVTYPSVKEQNIIRVSNKNSYEINENIDDNNVKSQIKTTPQSQKYFHLAEGFINAALTVPHTSIKYGVTQGRPDTDYPIYSTIPQTNFNCKEQRYKGFFGDPSTRCQVWHYCDLNGGKSSFLCPNGTIFSQAALTCDWWFNVKCESTRQLYVLNERLYKFILPIIPKFPEDFSGPEVDRYLELKFKEMEAKLKAKKLKKAMEKKMKEKQQINTEE